MSHKIDLRKISRRHYASWKDDGKDSMSFFDIFTFVIVPLIAGGISYLRVFRFEDFPDLAKTLITSFAILIGLLFSSLVMILNTVKMTKWTSRNKELMKEIIANISYCILAIIITGSLLLLQFVTPKEFSTIDLIFDSLIMALLFHILFTFLMVLKRTFGVAYAAAN